LSFMSLLGSELGRLFGSRIDGRRRTDDGFAANFQTALLSYTIAESAAFAEDGITLVGGPSLNFSPARSLTRNAMQRLDVDFLVGLTSDRQLRRSDNGTTFPEPAAAHEDVPPGRVHSARVCWCNGMR